MNDRIQKLEADLAAEKAKNAELATQCDEYRKRVLLTSQWLFRKEIIEACTNGKIPEGYVSLENTVAEVREILHG